MRVAIIPARGCSKRVPRKNVLDIGGQPMLTYPINFALESGLFDKVYVSTEDEEIAQVAIRWGASLINRPAKLASDRSTVVQVCDHALECIASTEGTVEAFCCLYATAIFITLEDLRASMAILDEKPEGDVVMGVSAYELHPVKALKQERGYWTRMWPEYAGMQSQFYPQLVASNGTLYWARTAAFRAEKTFYIERLKCYEIPRTRAVDIDTPENLQEARQLMDTRRAGTVR